MIEEEWGGFEESKIKGGHVRRASGPWETRNPAHVPHKTASDPPIVIGRFPDRVGQ